MQGAGPPLEGPHQAQLLQLLAHSEAAAAELRRELRAASRAHRVELLCCTLLSLALSWLALSCLRRPDAPRRPSGERRQSWPLRKHATRKSRSVNNF